MQKSKIKNQKYCRGITLIEIIVVLTVLILVLGTTISIFISILKKQTMLSIEDELSGQVNYAVEYISRLIREAENDESGSCLGTSYAGYNYVMSYFDSVSGFYQGIKFLSKDGTCQEFFLDTDGFLKEIKNSSTPQNILSNKFKVEYARFVINGDKTIQTSSKNDLIQPRLTFVINARTQDLNNPQKKVVQTTVSQKNLNIP